MDAMLPTSRPRQAISGNKFKLLVLRCNDIVSGDALDGTGTQYELPNVYLP